MKSEMISRSGSLCHAVAVQGDTHTRTHTRNTDNLPLWPYVAAELWQLVHFFIFFLLFRVSCSGRPKSQKQKLQQQDSHVVPHRATDWSVHWLAAQIGRDAAISMSYGRRCQEGEDSIIYLPTSPASYGQRPDGN